MRQAWRRELGNTAGCIGVLHLLPRVSAYSEPEANESVWAARSALLREAVYAQVKRREIREAPRRQRRRRVGRLWRSASKRATRLNIIEGAVNQRYVLPVSVG